MEHSNILLHLAEEDTHGPIPGSPAIYQTSNFLFSSVAKMRKALVKEDKIPFYTRGTNPTNEILNKKLAALEHTDNALTFSSGSAAIAAAVLANVNAGDHILSVSKPYSWTNKLFQQFLPRFGVETDLMDGTNANSFIAACKASTKVIFLESPNSWTYEMQDLEKISSFARKNGIITIIDNSYASPLNQSPADFGIDIITHSATKYLAGHSDIVAGVLCCSEAMREKIFKSEYMTLGALLSPFDAWLMIRSLRSLPLRMKHIGESTKEIIDALEGHAKIRKLFHPHAKSFEQPNLTIKYLKGISGLFTIDLKTDDDEQIERFCDGLKLFRLGCSWGSHESLAFPAITTVDSLNYNNPNIVKQRIRFSVGLDDPKLLIQDIKNALSFI